MVGVGMGVGMGGRCVRCVGLVGLGDGGGLGMLHGILLGVLVEDAASRIETG